MSLIGDGYQGVKLMPHSHASSGDLGNPSALCVLVGLYVAESAEDRLHLGDGLQIRELRPGARPVHDDVAHGYDCQRRHDKAESASRMPCGPGIGFADSCREPVARAYGSHYGAKP